MDVQESSYVLVLKKVQGRRRRTKSGPVFDNGRICVENLFGAPAA